MLTKIAVSIALVFLALQLARPELPSSPATAELEAPDSVKRILKQSCYACHSNERRLSWFDEIVPAYWLVTKDVKEARAHLNFSELAAKSPSQQRAALFQAVNFVRAGLMPLPSYRRLHPEAVVHPQQMAVLEAYLTPKVPVAWSAKASEAADREYRKWIEAGKERTRVQPAPNGIAFPADYRDWKAIDSTTRFDTDTFRVILGNDIAIQAIADNKVNPWPDGTQFAKVGWLQEADVNGVVRAGAFLKVGLMIKDKTKYASTAGWGWAEWEGTELRPYGDGPDFAQECVTCHSPQRKNDYAYTAPIPRSTSRTSRVAMQLNDEAALAGDLPANPLRWSVITCGTDPRGSTMSTLFGNDIAVRYSRTEAEGKYPPGSVLSLVTWQQQDDGRWFGAKMPARVKSVEFVEFTSAADGRGVRYRLYSGYPLKEAGGLTERTDARVAHLISLRAAVMP